MRFFVVSNLSAAQTASSPPIPEEPKLFIGTRFDSVVMTPRFRSTSPCSCGVALFESAHFGFRNSKFGGATIQADNRLGKYPHDGLVDIFQSGKNGCPLRREFLLV